MDSPHLRVGVDIGGTFTDIVIINTLTNSTETYKVLSTPREPAKGIREVRCTPRSSPHPSRAKSAWPILVFRGSVLVRNDVFQD